jgi:hypothetical protein
MAGFSWKKRKIMQGKGFEPLGLFSKRIGSGLVEIRPRNPVCVKEKLWF